jgi:FkbM family methyltransferase
VRAPQPPRVFLDVGASYGLHSLKLLAHGVRVVSFEPNPACQPFFMECCRHNGLRPDLRPVAVGDRAGRAELRVPRGRTWLGTTAGAVAAGWARDVEIETLHVPQVTLDEVVEIDGIVPDVIKIDTEGSELAVLEGARAILENARPMLVFESWPGTPWRPAIFTLLAAYGYRLHALSFAAPCSAALTGAPFVDSSASNFAAIHSSNTLLASATRGTVL